MTRMAGLWIVLIYQYRIPKGMLDRHFILSQPLKWLATPYPTPKGVSLYAVPFWSEKTKAQRLFLSAFVPLC